jgi:hypothetical protein
MAGIRGGVAAVLGTSMAKTCFLTTAFRCPPGGAARADVACHPHPGVACRARRAGLGKNVPVPSLGSHTRVMGHHTLLVIEETREDQQRYSGALGQFR